MGTHDRVPVLCTRGETMFYPTARVQLQMRDWRNESRVVTAPDPTIHVLLGRDIYNLQSRDLLATDRDPQTQRPIAGEANGLREKESDTQAEQFKPVVMDRPVPTPEESQELRGKEGESSHVSK